MLLVAGAVAAVASAACNSGPTQIAMPPLEVVVASGDGQFGVVNEALGAPLRVVVRSANTGTPREDVSVLWEVTQGSASVIGVASTITDSTGSTEVNLRMGGTPGEVRVRASVTDPSTSSATFQLFGVNRPTLTGVAPTAVQAGGTVTLTGMDFSPTAAQNVVQFSGIRGTVLSATATSLDVEVPACLPAREVAVTMQLGAVPGVDSIPVTITGGTEVTTMQVGDVLDVADDAGLACHALHGGTVAKYLALVYSASAVGAAKHPFQMTFLRSVFTVPDGARAPTRVSAPAEPAGSTSGPQERWDERLRMLEGELLRGRQLDAVTGSAVGGPSRVGASAVPAVGERRTFNVLNSSGGFSQVSAEARYVGARAAIFVDDEAPAFPDGFSVGDLASLSGRFDDVIDPVVTGGFGAASDIDANERIIILFTPAVNRLTPRGSNGFVGGFFFGVDLLTTSTGTNRGEIFYALVPDPHGLFSDAHTKSEVLQAVPAVLAHEFQHMVHFNQRVLVRGAANQEALWLSEALAQMAEELVARAYEGQGDAGSANLFRAGAVQRARRYLVGTDSVSLVVTAGQGSLAERGAGFLHVLYLERQRGLGLLGDLTQTTVTGVANVEAQTGSPWAGLLADWWAATYLDGPGPDSSPLTYPGMDLREYLTPGTSTFPLVPRAVGPEDARDQADLWSSSVRYYEFSAPFGETVSVRLGGASGGPSAPQSALRLRLIRIS